jgi:hyaluronan synthase
MYTFYLSLERFFGSGSLHVFLVFFLFVWLVWLVKVTLAAFYRPAQDPLGLTSGLRTTVLVPTYNEPEPVFRRVLESVAANRPTELIVIVDGADPDVARVASDYTERVLAIPKLGKRAGIWCGLEVSDPTTDVVIVLDSDSVWEPDTLTEMLKPFADPRVGGVTPKQAIFDRDGNTVRRLADWIEDLRYHGTAPAQALLGQVGCLAGRTIAYRRAAFEPAVDELVKQQVLGVLMDVGDDRVLTNHILKAGWRTTYQSTTTVYTDAPDTWPKFWSQQLRWGRSSQREVFLSLSWLWKRPFALFCFLADMVIPFALYVIMATAAIRVLHGARGLSDMPLFAQLMLAYFGAIVSIGVRQVPHFIRYPRDIQMLPLFVLQLTFFMAPTRVAAFATMFHQHWRTRSQATGRPGAQPAVQLGADSPT